MANSFDESVFNFVVDHEPQWLVTVSEKLTLIGGTMAALAIALATTVLLWGPSQRRLRRCLPILAVAVSAIVSRVVKGLFDRARPDSAARWFEYSVSSSSFPSEHATHVAALAVSVFLLTFPRQKVVACLALILGVAVGLTRLFLGVHWASDVLAGWMLGAGCALGVAAVIRWRSKPTIVCE